MLKNLFSLFKKNHNDNQYGLEHSSFEVQKIFEANKQQLQLNEYSYSGIFREGVITGRDSLSYHLMLLVKTILNHHEKTFLLFRSVDWCIGFSYDPNANKWNMIAPTDQSQTSQANTELDEDDVVNQLKNKIITCANFYSQVNDFTFAFETRVYSSEKIIAALKLLEQSNEAYKKPSTSSEKTIGGITIDHILAGRGDFDFSNSTWSHRDRYGRTPLEIAMTYGRVNIKNLIDKAIENQPNHINNIIIDMMFIARLRYRTMEMVEKLKEERFSTHLKDILIIAAKQGNIDILQDLLSVNDSILNSANQNNLLVATALQHGHVTFFEAVMSEIQDIDITKEHNGKTLHDLAEKIRIKSKRDRAIDILNRQLLKKITNEDPAILLELKKFGKYKENILDLIRYDKKLIEKTINDEFSALHKFFYPPYGHLPGKVEKELLNEIYLAYVSLTACIELNPEGESPMIPPIFFTDESKRYFSKLQKKWQTTYKNKNNENDNSYELNRISIRNRT